MAESIVVGPFDLLYYRVRAWPKRAAQGHAERGRLAQLLDPVTRRQRLYGLLAQRIARIVDPALTITFEDGYATEGPVVSIQYPRDCSLSFTTQEHALHRVLEALRATHARPFAVLGRPEHGYRFPFIEIPCDLAHHRSMVYMLASAPPALRAQIMQEAGILPAVVALSRDLLANPGVEEEDDDG